MKVEISSLPSGSPMGALRVGDVCFVLEIYIIGGVTRYRVAKGNTVIGIIDSIAVKIVDNVLNLPDLVATVEDYGLIVQPAGFAVPGFWERWLDGLPEERAEVDEIVFRINASVDATR